MSQYALKEAKKHILFHHSPDSSDGWITLAKKEPSGRFRQYHYRPEELADHLSEWIGEDCYYSQNTFYVPKRRIDTIRQLRSLYVDLDVYNIGMNPDYILQKLEFEMFGQNIPDPNMVIFSGRGLVLIWNIEPIPYKAMPLWKSVENYLVEQLKEVGSDKKATDPARIFRIAGTINSKNGAMVKAEYRHNYRYDIHQIQYDYLPELEPKKLQQKKPGRKSKVVRLFNIYTLHLARARDIAKLVELRGGNVGNCREYICFLYRYFTCCYTDNPERALADMLDLNSEFTIPLPEREVIQATKSAEKAWEARSNEKANQVAKSMGYPGAGYNMKNSDIIEWLWITPEEEMELETIIGAQEKKRRNTYNRRIKRRQEGTRPQKEFLKQHNDRQKKQVNDKALSIKKAIEQSPGASNMKLSEITGIPRSTVIRLRKTLNL